MTVPFFIRFLLCNLVICGLTVGIILTKKLLKNHISIRFQYYIWYAFLVLLLLPFLTIKPFLFHIIDWFELTSNTATITNNISNLNSGTTNTLSKNGWLQDFTLSVTHSNSQLMNSVIIVCWVIGIAVMTVLTIRNNIKVRKILNRTQQVKGQDINTIFDQCKNSIGIHKNVRLYSSSLIMTPITCGLFHPCVVLPVTTMLQFSKNDIRNIFLHELQHYKHKDIITNYIMCLLQIIYWFNPLVWYAFKEMRTDREIACDISVLEMLDEDSYVEYGNTIINFADQVLRKNSLTFVSDMGGSKQQIKKRILKIATFHTESHWMKLKSILIFSLIGMIIIASSPILSIRAAVNNRYDFHSNKITYEDLSSYFSNYNGCFVLYDTKADQYTMYNKDRCCKRFSPDSTYKIYSALFGLETGVISKDNSTSDWNGITYAFAPWNKKQDLSSAMENSVTWYFQDLDEKIGIDTLQKYFNNINYGNTDLSGGITNYWMQSSLLISPIEQIELLRAFYNNDFDFKKENIQTVKDVILLSETNGITLSGKTGTGNVNGKNVNGWFVGYVEGKDNTYFFATNIQSPDNSNGSAAAKISLSILKDKNIYSSDTK